MLMKQQIWSLLKPYSNKKYVPVKDMMYPTVYESKITSFPLKPGAGEKIAETASELGNELA